MAVVDLDLGRYKLGWADDEDFVFRPEKGLTTDVIDQMSWWKILIITHPLFMLPAAKSKRFWKDWYENPVR